MHTQATEHWPPETPWGRGGIEVIPQSKYIGAEITGVELGAMSEQAFEIVHDAWLKHTVLVFRDQRLTDPDLVAVSARFGELDVAPLDENGRSIVPGCPELLVISNVLENGKRIGALGAGEAVWHTDMSYDPVPPKGSALYSLEVPAEGGGETGFLSCYAAYDALPAAQKSKLATMSIKHDATRNSTGGKRQGVGDVVDLRTSPGAFHPVVRTHPETGRKALYLGRRPHAYVKGLDIEASEALLDELWAHTTNEEFTFHHQWRVGDLILWDNRCVMHRRNAFDPNSRRIMHRTQIKGTVPV